MYGSEIHSEVWYILDSCWLSRFATLALADASHAQSKMRMRMRMRMIRCEF
jgi:hypothetical protein